jgi:hypothetical protein
MEKGKGGWERMYCRSPGGQKLGAMEEGRDAAGILTAFLLESTILWLP